MKKVIVVGSSIIDLMARTPRLPVSGETVMGSFFKMGPGGKGLNQAIAASRAGADVAFYSKVGKDEFSSIVKKLLDSESNIDSSNIHYSELSTGIALISVDEVTKNNQIVVVPGASYTFDDKDLENLDPLLKDAEYLLLQMEINPDALEKIIVKAHEYSVKIILNPAPAAEIPEYLYKMIYIITPNETEAAFLAKMECNDEEGYHKIASWFIEKGVENVIITIGKKGAYLENEKGESHIFPNYDVDVVDSTGAGDAFNGGLVAALSIGMSIFDSCTFASAVANLAVTKTGTSVAMPYENDVLELIKRSIE